MDDAHGLSYVVWSSLQKIYISTVDHQVDVHDLKLEIDSII